MRIINGYGPTECTTFSVCHSITEQDTLTGIPIGHPISNTFTYVLDAAMGLSPIGVPGVEGKEPEVIAASVVAQLLVASSRAEAANADSPEAAASGAEAEGGRDDDQGPEGAGASRHGKVCANVRLAIS